MLLYPSKGEGMFVPESLIFRSDSNGEDLEGYAGAGESGSVWVCVCVCGIPTLYLSFVPFLDRKSRLLWMGAGQSGVS